MTREAGGNGLDLEAAVRRGGRTSPGPVSGGLPSLVLGGGTNRRLRSFQPEVVGRWPGARIGGDGHRDPHHQDLEVVQFCVRNSDIVRSLSYDINIRQEKAHVRKFSDCRWSTLNYKHHEKNFGCPPNIRGLLPNLCSVCRYGRYWIIGVIGDHRCLAPVSAFSTAHARSSQNGA